jgi:hypothetical protein
MKIDLRSLSQKKTKKTKNKQTAIITHSNQTKTTVVD